MTVDKETILKEVELLKLNDDKLRFTSDDMNVFLDGNKVKFVCDYEAMNCKLLKVNVKSKGLTDYYFQKK